MRKGVTCRDLFISKTYKACSAYLIKILNKSRKVFLGISCENIDERMSVELNFFWGIGGKIENHNF